MEGIVKLLEIKGICKYKKNNIEELNCDVQYYQF